MPTPSKTLLMVCLVVMVFLAASRAQAQTGKDSMVRGPIADATAAKDEAQKKAGLVGWISLKQPAGPGLRVFVKDKTKLEKLVGKERRPATFTDLKKGATVELVYVLHDGQPSAGPTLADAKLVLILAESK